MRRIVRALIGIGSLVAAMALTAGTAFAGSDYNVPGDVAGEQTGGGGGSLPFTGSDLLMYVLIGAAVAVGGIALRMLAPRR